MTFPPIRTNENISTTTTAANIYHDHVIWDDPDLDIESTTSIVSNKFTGSSISTVYFDSIDKILPNNNTIIDNLAIKQTNSSLKLSNLNDTSLSLSSTVILSTIRIEEDDSIMFNTSSIKPITRFEHLSADDNIESNVDMNDYILYSTTPIIDLLTFIPYHSVNNKTKNQLFEYIKPLETLGIPPFSWMLNMAAQNKSQFLNSTTITTEKPKLTTITTTTASKTPDIFYEYCKNKQCYHGGHLNSDCLCICLPTFTGDNCETGIRKFSFHKKKNIFFFFIVLCSTL